MASLVRRWSIKKNLDYGSGIKYIISEKLRHPFLFSDYKAKWS